MGREGNPKVKSMGGHPRCEPADSQDLGFGRILPTAGLRSAPPVQRIDPMIHFTLFHTRTSDFSETGARCHRADHADSSAWRDWEVASDGDGARSSRCGARRRGGRSTAFGHDQPG